MAFDLNKEIVIKGIGKGTLTSVKNVFTEITHAQGLKLDVKSTLQDVSGGDSLFPIYTFVSKREGSIELDMATFSASQAGVMQATSNKVVGVKSLNRIILKTTESSLGAFTGVEGVKCKAPDGTLIPVELGAGVVAPTGCKVTATGAVTWGATVTASGGEYVFWFKADAADAVEMSMLKSAMPDVQEFFWMQESESLDGGKYKVDIYAKRVRADGGFNLDLANDKATVPKMRMQILDPGDGNESFCTITVTKIA